MLPLRLPLCLRPPPKPSQETEVFLGRPAGHVRAHFADQLQHQIHAQTRGSASHPARRRSRASSSWNRSMAGAFLPGVLGRRQFDFARRPPPSAGGKARPVVATALPSPGRNRRSSAGRFPTAPAPGATQRAAPFSSSPAGFPSPRSDFFFWICPSHRASSSPGLALALQRSRAPLCSPLTPVRSLMTSWNLIFIRSSACCIFCTWPAAPMMWSAAQPLVILQPPDVRRRHETAAQQPVRVQGRQPLAVGHVGLATGHVLHVPPVDHHHFQPGGFQHLVEIEPVNPRGFHRHRAHPLLLRTSHASFPDRR